MLVWLLRAWLLHRGWRAAGIALVAPGGCRLAMRAVGASGIAYAWADPDGWDCVPDHRQWSGLRHLIGTAIWLESQAITTTRE